MIGWLRRWLPVFDRRQGPVVPEDPEQARILAHADRLLASPKVRELEKSRSEQLRGSFQRADRRLARR